MNKTKKEEEQRKKSINLFEQQTNKQIKVTNQFNS